MSRAGDPPESTAALRRVQRYTAFERTLIVLTIVVAVGGMLLATFVVVRQDDVKESTEKTECVVRVVALTDDLAVRRHRIHTMCD